MAAPEWLAYFTAAKSALDIIKGIRAKLPKGPAADTAQQKIEEAESALKNSKARLGQPDRFSPCRVAEMLRVDKIGREVRC